jgi:hypothetical protein
MKSAGQEFVLPEKTGKLGVIQLTELSVLALQAGADVLETPEEVPVPETIRPWSSTSATAAKFV